MGTRGVKNIAVDKEMLYMLVKWAYLDDYDYNNAIRKLYRKHQLIPSKLREDDVRQAPFMSDGWTRAIRRDKQGDKYFDNLNSVIDLYNACMNGKYNLYIVPTVLSGVIHDQKSADESICMTANHAMEFIRDCATTLRVNEEDFGEFDTMRRALVKKYRDEQIFDNKKRHEACSLAESALFGLHYVVKRDSVYIHFDYEKKDCGKLKKIAQIHFNTGIVANNKGDDKFVVPQVWTARFLLMKDEKKALGQINYPMWVDSNAIQDGAYVPLAER